jgi:pyridoxal 5'-phosphate synthase pdxT subunit
MKVKIGVLAIQGDFEAHARMLERLGAETVLVKTPADMEGIRGLVLPGGESTTHLKVLREEGLLEAIRQFAADGGAIFGTCAGAILLAREVHGPAQESLGLMDIAVRRNGYGRQAASQVISGKTTLREGAMEMVFIRAPLIESVKKGVEVLGEYEGHPVLVREGRMMAATFHPELTADTTIHREFLSMAKNGH